MKQNHQFLPKGDERLKNTAKMRKDVTLMKSTFAKLGLGFWVFPAILAANPYDGVYKQTANAECALVGVDGGSLKIADNIFYGVEVECLMTDPVDVSDMDATLYEMQCSGEGETWTERAMLMPDAEDTGLYMIWSGYAFRYDRCEDPDS
jgi:hypothetical protein